MRSSWVIQVDPKSSDVSLSETEEEQTKRRSHLKTEAETGEKQPQAQGYLGPAEAGRDKRRFSPTNFRGSVALLTP